MTTAQMVCLGLEPGAAEWKVQTNPLSYGGTPGEESGIGTSYWLLIRLCDSNLLILLFYQNQISLKFS